MHFTYKGKSSKDFCLKIKEINNLSSPTRALEVHSILGRNGDLVIDNGNYNNFQLQITCFLDGRPERNDKELSLAELASELKAWLQTSFSYSELSIDDDEYYYECYLDNSLDIKELFLNFAEVLLTFNCKPFKKKNNDKITITEKGHIITNNTPFDAESYFKVYGNGDIILFINQQRIEFLNVVNYIEIDSELMNCFKDETNQNNKMIGEFPVLKSGDNSVQWSGDVTKIEVIVREVRL